MLSDGSGNLVLLISGNGSSWDITSSCVIGAVTANAWQHIAVDWDGTTYRTYKNGVAGGTVTSSTAPTGASGRDLWVGNYGGGASGFAGYIDELRWDGSSRFPSAFTPPASAYAVLANNLTVRSAAFTAAAAPTSMKIVALVNHVDTATAGTDYKLKVSRDGGAHLSGYLTLNNRFTIAGGSIHVIESDAIDVTGITTGSSPLWQFETFNNKMVELLGVYLYWT